MTEVLIVGGAAMGWVTAHHLRRLEDDLDVTVVERDPTVRYSSTMLSAGNVGIQFYLEKNIVISQYAMQCLERFSEEMAVGDDAPDPQMRKQGNLSLVDVDGRDMPWQSSPPINGSAAIPSGSTLTRSSVAIPPWSQTIAPEKPSVPTMAPSTPVRWWRATDARPSPTAPEHGPRHWWQRSESTYLWQCHAIDRHPAETIVGRPHSLDLSRLGPGRIVARDALLEHAGRII